MSLLDRGFVSALGLGFFMTLGACAGNDAPPATPDANPMGDTGVPDASPDAPPPDAPGDCSSDADCDDSVFCNGVETCVAGTCMAGEALMDGTACDDSDRCTTGDVCAAGACAGIAVDCSAMSDTCNVGTCNPADGACGPVAMADGTMCDDGVMCTSGDVCTTGVCGGTAIDCSGMDGNCLVGTCVEADGSCMAAAAADDTGCDDADACTTTDICTGGACAGAAVDCSAMTDMCNVGVCSAADGSCGTTPVADDTMCDDADAMTHADVCTAGVCAGSLGVTYLGYATWRQSAGTQTDAQQDTLMNAACATAYSGSRAAKTDELMSRVIIGLPSTNTSGRYLVARCPSCEGRAHTGCASGHARNCTAPSAVWPSSLPWTSETNCHTSSRSTICVR